MARYKVFRYRIRITESDIDIMGHVNNVAYVNWMQNAAVAHSNANGWDWEKYQSLGLAWFAKSHQIEYLKSAFREDSLYIDTWVAGMKRVSSTRAYRFFRETDGDMIARAETKWAMVKLEDFRPTRIPEIIQGAFEVVDDSPNASEPPSSL